MKATTTTTEIGGTLYMRLPAKMVSLIIETGNGKTVKVSGLFSGSFAIINRQTGSSYIKVTQFMDKLGKRKVFDAEYSVTSKILTVK